MRPTMQGQPYGSICQRTRHFEEIVRVAGRLNLPGKARQPTTRKPAEMIAGVLVLVATLEANLAWRTQH
jgi:hypothetical protein